MIDSEKCEGCPYIAVAISMYLKDCPLDKCILEKLDEKKEHWTDKSKIIQTLIKEDSGDEPIRYKIRLFNPKRYFNIYSFKKLPIGQYIINIKKWEDK